MFEICNHLSCTACGACSNVCSKNAITMKEDEEGFLYPYIEEIDCINCGLCRKVCPINNSVKSTPATFYMAWNKDEEVLKKSSSGGVFTAIAKYIIGKGGVVFGAAKDPDTWDVYHKMIDNVQALDELRLSKYYQSNVKEVYQIIRHLLLQNRYVLFTGTACQVAGLYSFLEIFKISNDIIRGGGPNQRLITVDVLCHGCTSKKAIICYIKSKEKEYKKRILNFQFRVKTRNVGWHNGGGDQNET